MGQVNPCLHDDAFWELLRAIMREFPEIYGPRLCPHAGAPRPADLGFQTGL